MILKQQMQEREGKKLIDSEMIKEQAVMWDTDKKAFEEKEKRQQELLKKEKQSNAEYLQRQMELKG